MPITCSNCGNTKHLPGARNCAVCGALLPAPVVPSPHKAAVPAVPIPMLVTQAGRRYRLSATGETLIGSRGCAITLAEPGVLPQHARIFPSGGGFSVEDIGGGIKVNGQIISAAHALRPGDIIAVGVANLVYQGPLSSSGAVVSHVPAPPPGPAVARPAMVPAAPLPHPMKPAVPLKVWGKDPPVTEGDVTLVDGPHMVDKGNMGAKLVAAAALGIFTRGMLAFLPFMGRRETPAWFLRIKDAHTGQDVSVLMAGQPTSLPQLGDTIAVWGKVQEGNVFLERAYNYATNSEIRVKR